MDKGVLKEIITATNHVENIYRCKKCKKISNPCYKYLHFYCEECIKNIKSPKNHKQNNNHTRIVSLLKSIENKCYSMYFTNTFHKKNSKGETDLHRACQSKDLFKVRGLVALGASVNEKDYANWTPLHDAVRAGNVEIIEELLLAGSCVNAPGDLCVTPLQKAVIENRVDIVKLLIKFGANIHLRNYEGLTALDYATEQVRKMIVGFSKNEVCQQVKQVTKYDDPYMECTVLVTGSEEQLRAAEHLAKQMEWIKYTNKLTSNVTHVVVPDKVVDVADMHVLTAILRMLPVVTYQWLESCAQQCKLTPLWPYYVTANQLFATNVMDVVEQNRKQLAPKLFDGINFYLSGSNELSSTFKLRIESSTLTQLEIHTIIREGGGNVLTREPHTRNVVRPGGYPWHAVAELEQCCHYVLYDRPQLLRYNMRELRHVPVSWLLECVWNYKIITLNQLKYDPGLS